MSWSSEYEIGHGVIDAQHQELFAIFNRLHEAMMERRTTEVMTRTFNDLERYVRFHFRTEEMLMDRHGFPDAERHKAAHDDFAGRLLELYSDFERGRHTVAMEAAIFLRSWLNSHIPVADRKLGEYVKG